MMDSLRATAAGLEWVDQARRQKRWNKTAALWLSQAFVSHSTLNRFWARQAINRQSFIAICAAVEVDWQTVADLSPVPQSQAIAPGCGPFGTCALQNWGDAPEIQHFCGRAAEQNTLQTWIDQDHCRMIVITGMGGIGKTAIAAHMAHQLQGLFEALAWRSLRNAPDPNDFLTELLQVLNQTPTQEIPNSYAAKVNQLLVLLRQRRCLLVLDNAESILPGALSRGSSILNPSDRNRAGKAQRDRDSEPYGQLLRTLAETAHPSCVLLTSRELPAYLADLEGAPYPVRCLPLKGLLESDSQQLCQGQGQFSGSSEDWQQLVALYAGNPLALKIAAAVVQDIFGGSLPSFLSSLTQESMLFGDLRALLTHQVQRLSPREQSAMYWLAINREPIALEVLQADAVTSGSVAEWFQVMASLQRRSLVETIALPPNPLVVQANPARCAFTQQPVVMAYMIERLVQQVALEIEDQGSSSDCPQLAGSLLQSHALVKAQAPEYIYKSQVRLILEPVLQRVLQQMGTLSALEHCAQTLLSRLRGKPRREIGYAAGNLVNLLRLADICLQDYDLSRLPLWQANLQDTPLMGVSCAYADLSRTLFTESLGNFLAAAFSPDGQRLVTSDNGYLLRLWDIQSGKLLTLCQGHTHWIRCVAFAPTPSPAIQQQRLPLLASGSADQTIRLWHGETGEALQILMGHQDEVFAIDFSGDGTQLVSASADQTLKVWDVMSGQCLNTLTGHQGRVRTVAISPIDSDLIASGGEDGTVKLWHRQTGTCLCSWAEHRDWVRAIAFSPEGQLLASGSDDQTIRLWSLPTRTCQQVMTGHQGGVYALAFAQQEATLASGGADGQIRLWDSATGERLTSLAGHCNQLFSLRFSPNSQLLAGVSLDRTVKLWDWQQGHCLKTWRGYTDWGFPIDFSDSGQFLASGSGSELVRIWDWQTQTCLQELKSGCELTRAVVFSSDDTLLMVAGASSVIEVWHWQFNACVQQLQGHTDWVFDLAIAPQADVLASGSADKTIRLWQWQTGTCMGVLAGHTDQVYGVAFSPQPAHRHLLASASADQTIRIWNWQTGDCLLTLKGHRNRVYSVAWSPNSGLIASTSGDRTVKIWDTTTGNCLQTLTDHEGWVFAVAFSPEGQQLVTGAQDQTVKVWDIAPASCRQTFRQHQHQVYAVAYHPQGHLIASGSQDQTIRLWNVADGTCLQVLSARLYENLDITGAIGLSEAQRLTLKALGAHERERPESI